MIGNATVSMSASRAEQKTALIYEDPAVDQNLQDDYPLTALSLWVGQFIPGRAQCRWVNGRYVDINEIARCFDRTGNGGTLFDERWGLDGALYFARSNATIMQL